MIFSRNMKLWICLAKGTEIRMTVKVRKLALPKVIEIPIHEKKRANRQLSIEVLKPSQRSNGQYSPLRYKMRS
jgi:hypothetical protein